MLPGSGACPLVAVVTPVLNGEKYLSETMESVQALEYPHLVHVVLDNASTDSTPAIIERYRNRRVPLLSARQAITVSMGANWNAAAAMVPREAGYFRILCSDDTLRPDAITRQVEVAERDHDIGIVGCLWRAEGLCGEELPKDRDIFNGKEVIRGYLRREHSALSGNHVLVRRSELDVGRSFYDETIVCFDADLNMRICLRSKFGFVRQELGVWRVHPGSTTSKRSKALTNETEWLLLLDRYGPQVLGFREYLECRTAYRCHLLRRLLKLRVSDGNVAALAECLKCLRLRDDAVGPLDFAQALADWAILALTRRRHLVGLPRRSPARQQSPAAATQAPRELDV